MTDKASSVPHSTVEDASSNSSSSNNSSSTSPSTSSHHARRRSWSSNFDDNNMILHTLRKPPPAPRRKSIDEERQSFHDSNRKFLERADKERHHRSSTPVHVVASPKKPAQHRRLESIEEVVDTSELLLLPDLVDGGPRHARIHSDEVSVLSAGSWSSWFSAATGNHPQQQQQQQQVERMALFERQQQGQFNKTKHELGGKLSAALDSRASGNSTKSASDEPKIFSEREKNEFIRRYMEELEQEREALLAQWKLELEAERAALHPAPLSVTLYKAVVEPCWESLLSTLALVEVFIANLPLTIGAVGLSWVTMGTVWFKFMEENVDFCVPVHYYSSKCTFPEYPGCFHCNVDAPVYRAAVSFHFACSTVAGLCCLLFLLKMVIAWKVVVDELSNPTTCTPMGVVCIATVCVFAGRGVVGEGIVLATSIVHFLFAFWFLYMAIVKFGLYPDPGWFPSTVGVTYAAVKTWLYFPVPGMILLCFAVLFFFALFFVSTVRVALNKKIAAPVAWIGLSAPSITMYALTLVAQPTPYKEELLESDHVIQLRNHEWMTQYYLPFQHVMMILSLVGLGSAVHALSSRWEQFRRKPFSPAHVAFCFPTLSHCNAVQAYRGAVNAFSRFPSHGAFKTTLYVCWVSFLVGGTVLNLIFSYMFVRRLPKWTKLETAGEDEPPAPQDTFVHEMLDGTGVHELFLRQPFVSPAVLEANEAGALVRVRRGTEEFRLHGPYVRTRQVTSLGFDPTMTEEELRRERAQLLDWVAKNAPRTRNRTMSNPLILRSRGQDGAAQDLAYGTFAATEGGESRQHKRSVTTTGVVGV